MVIHKIDRIQIIDGDVGVLSVVKNQTLDELITDKIS
jgi:hypothetical protein